MTLRNRAIAAPQLRGPKKVAPDAWRIVMTPAELEEFTALEKAIAGSTLALRTMSVRRGILRNRAAMRLKGKQRAGAG